MLKVIALFFPSIHRFPLPLAVVFCMGAKAWAQEPTPAPKYPTDWMVSGQPRHHVKVLDVGGDYVSIIDDSGGGQIPLSTLSPELQKLFNYPHPVVEVTTPHGLHYKDVLVGTGEAASKGDVITFTLTGKTYATLQALKDVATARLGVLQAQKTTEDTALTTAQAKYQASLTATDSSNQLKAYNDLQTAQKNVQDVEQQIGALQTNTYTIPYGDKDLLPNLGEVLEGMKVGGQRAVVPPEGPKSPAYQPPITVGGPSPTPTPTPKPSDIPPPALSYEVDVTEIDHPADGQ